MESSERPSPVASGRSEPSVAELRAQLARVEHDIQEVRREVTHRHGPTFAEGPSPGH